MRFPRERKQEVSSCAGSNPAVLGWDPCMLGWCRKPSSCNSLLVVWFLLKRAFQCCLRIDSSFKLVRAVSPWHSLPGKRSVDVSLCKTHQEKLHKLQGHASIFGTIAGTLVMSADSIIPHDASAWYCLGKGSFYRGCDSALPSFSLTLQLGKVSTHLEGATSHRSTISFWKPWFRDFLSQRLYLHLCIW